MNTITSSYPADLSLDKQRVFTRYANGEITLAQVGDEIEKIKPQIEPLSRSQRWAIALTTFVLALLIPSWARRNDV